ncbi:Lrp/AsnC family transcriptional regulator [Limimaricola hongkongensis]|uniref:PutR, transcriptional activator of PutA and PutP n=1 Tax=Limimaricola hongkongensis DSM 17492 TaxID=1122180 RepID=A0A017H7Z4_9RHOB|nr:Lrp/AsnC family transcriptional regulator [Limimaricola hongkongensis]EYD70425.1 PutR, transcriptional activator of PutA and PutP [Limimaricola hongkongensis DSM 17492]
MTTRQGAFPDPTDHRILAELLANARLPVTALAARVGLSKSPCQVRLKRLQARGVIRGFRALIDPALLGRDHVAFVELRLSRSDAAALDEFDATVRRLPEVEQCHLVAGRFDYLLKIRSRDLAAFRDSLGARILALPHVAATTTHLALQPVVEGPGQPARCGTEIRTGTGARTGTAPR